NLPLWIVLWLETARLAQEYRGRDRWGEREAWLVSAPPPPPPPEAPAAPAGPFGVEPSCPLVEPLVCPRPKEEPLESRLSLGPFWWWGGQVAGGALWQLYQPWASRCGPVAAEQGFWNRGALGSRVRVSYSDDDVDHERYLAWPSRRVEDGICQQESVWWVLSPDDDLWRERLDGGDPEHGPSGAVPMPSSGYPHIVGRRLYRFRARPTLDRLAQLAKGCRDIESALGQEPSDWPQSAMTETGEMQGLGTVMGVSARELPALGDIGADDEMIWMLMEPGGGKALGEEVKMSGSDVMLGSHGLKVFGTEVCRVARVKVSDAPRFAGEQLTRMRRALGTDTPPGELADEDSVQKHPGLGDRVAEATAGSGEARGGHTVEDARTLAVDYDGHGERHKGPVSVVYLAKAMRRSGGDPMRWLAEWSREHRVERQDRIYHELEVLCHALLLAGSYDHLNLGGLRSMGRLARRIQVITDAHSVPGAPANWRMARCLTGETGPSDAVAPELRSFGAKKAKEDAEFLSARVRGLTGADRALHDKGGRERRRLLHVKVLNEAISSLNWLAGASVGSSAPLLSDTQLDVIKRIDGQVYDIAQPMRGEQLQPPYSALRGERMLRDLDGATEMLARCSDFVRDLVKRGLVSFSRTVVEMGLSAFELEAVGGARDHLEAAYLAAIEDVEFSVGVADVKDAFHRTRLPAWMKLLFGLPSLRAGDVGIHGSRLDGEALGFDDLVYPIPEALPMGCTWSLYLCQSVTELRCQLAPAIAGSAPLSDLGEPLVLKIVCGTEQVEHCVYVDNMGVLGQNGERVSNSLDELVRAFVAVGLKVHGREVRSDGIEVLGVVLDGQRLQTRPSLKRVWRARQALVGVLRMRAVRGHDLRALLGHCTYLGLVRRPVLSVFHACYRFVSKVQKECAPLWRSCREELEAFKGLLPMIVSDWWLPCNRWVQCSDASETGYGVSGSYWDLESLNVVGRCRERRRFRTEEGQEARRSALTAAGIGEFLEAKVGEAKLCVDEGEKWLIETTLPEGDYELDPDFSEAFWLEIVVMLSGPASRSRLLLRSQPPIEQPQERRARVLTREAARPPASAALQNQIGGKRPAEAAKGQATPSPEEAGADASCDTRRRATGKRGRSAVPSSSGTTSESEAATTAKRQRTLERRVKRRRAAVSRAIEDGVPIGRYLESSTATPKVRAQYHRALEQMKDRCGRQDLFEMPSETLDVCIVHYFTTLYLEGEQASTGMYVAAAVNHFSPKYGRLGASALPRMWKALKGWKMLTPGRARMPEPLSIWCALMHGLVLRNQRMMAVFLALAVSTYLRPSSLFRLRPGDIVKPGGGSRFWGLLMHPQERATPDNVGEFDLSVKLDSSWLLWLGPVLEKLQRQDPTKPVWQFDYPQLLREMRSTCDTLQLGRITPYQARHSGASIDRASNERSQAEVQRRGGWRQLKNMARYEKSARLGHRAQQHTAVMVAYGEQCLRELEPALLWGRAAPLPGGIQPLPS
ncbi:unnamed protein product, partial [Prorocentrum cordatum]